MPSKPRLARSSESTKQSITRTELLSSTHSSRPSCNSVDCPRSAPSTKRFMNCPPANRQANHSRQLVFTQPGSKPEKLNESKCFRCSPNNGHRQDTSACPFRANKRLMHCCEKALYSITSSAIASSNGQRLSFLGREFERSFLSFNSST